MGTNGEGTLAALADPLMAQSPDGSMAQSTPQSGVVGLVGTQFFAGMVRDQGEYNSNLQPPYAFQTYEKMRRSDADIAAALLACKLPIRAAEYQVVPGVEENDPGFAAAEEVAKFVEDNLLGGLEYVSPAGVKVSQSFEKVIENALLMLEFGCAAHENILAIDGARVHLARCSPRLPSTFYRFLPDSDGETLVTLEQQGYRGDKYETVQVPSSKLAFFSYDQEGANFWGRSLLRAVYKHWYMKEQLERIECIGNEKNSLGVPTIIQGPGATKEDREAAELWLKRLAAHEQTGISLPNGWEFKLQGVEGDVRKPIEFIRYLSEMIGRRMLAMFLAYGTTQTGTRALGESSTDFFKLSLESLAWNIAETITQSTIRPLVDFNFGAQEQYPYLRFGNIMATDPLKILGVVKDLAAANVSLIEPDDEAEAWAREQLGMPAKATARVRPAPIGPSGDQAIGPLPKPNGEMAQSLNHSMVLAEDSDGSWVTLEGGAKVFIGKGGVIEKGPAGMVGKRPENLGKGEGGAGKGATSKGKSPGAAAHAEAKDLHDQMNDRLGNFNPQVDGSKIEKYANAQYPRLESMTAKIVGKNDERVKNARKAFESGRALSAAGEHGKALVKYSIAVSWLHTALGREEEARASEIEPPEDGAMNRSSDPSIRLAEPRYPLNRELKDVEKKVDWEAHGKRQDVTAGQIARVLRQAKPPLVREAARQASQLGVQNLMRLTLPFDHSLAQRLVPLVKRAHTFGHEQVYRERKKATGRGRNQPPVRLVERNDERGMMNDERGDRSGDSSFIVHPSSLQGADRRPKRRLAAHMDNPQFIAEATVTDLEGWVTRAAQTAATELLKQGLMGADLEDEIVSDVLALTDGALDRMGLEAARSGIAGGRGDAMGELQDEIARWIRTEAMDQNTCEPCASGDAAEWGDYDEVDWSPGDDCEGGDACRGQLVGVFADEGQVISD